MYRQLLTDLGRDVIARGQAGGKITFTRVTLGQGTIDPALIPGMSALISPVMNSPIVAVAHTGLGQCTITTKLPLASIPQEFFMTEIGVFAKIDNEAEVLYGISYSDRPDPISPEMAGGATQSHTISIAVVVGATEEVTAIFDPDIDVINIGPPAIGPGFFANRVGAEFRFKRAVAAGGGIEITEDADTVRFRVGAPIPVGGIVLHGGTFAPEGWLFCRGGTRQITEFPALAAALGTTFGGDGVTTFGLPDLRDRVPLGAGGDRALGTRGGAESHFITLSELPTHSHGLTQSAHSHYVNDPQHAHGTFEMQHAHGISDPTHTHAFVYFNYTTSGVGNSGSEFGNNFWGQVQPSATGISILGAVTGLSIRAAPTGIWLDPAHAQITVNPAGGGDQALSLLQPFLAINYIIRALA